MTDTEKDNVLVGEDYHDDSYLGEPTYTETSYTDGPVGMMLSEEYLSCFKLGRFVIKCMANMTGAKRIHTFVVIDYEDFKLHFRGKDDSPVHVRGSLYPEEE
jgi:hypothetical protein